MSGFEATGRTQPQDSRADLRATLCTLVVGAAIVGCLQHYNLTAASLDPSRFRYSWEEYLVVNIAALVLPPIVLVLVVLREDLRVYGMSPAPLRAYGVAAAMLAAMTPVLWVVSRRPEFQGYYPIQPQAARTWTYFVYFELSYAFYMFAWEWFYRGFLTFGLARRFGFAAAILLQAIAFGFMHWGKPMPEFYSSFAGGIVLGWLAMRSRSFVPCFVLHWCVSLGLDVFAIHAGRGGIF